MERVLFIGTVQAGLHGKDVPVEITLGDPLAAINSDGLLRASVNDPEKLMDRALLCLHEHQVVTLGKGLSVSRSAMALHINPKDGGSTTRHFAPLEDYYGEQTVRTHMMAAYAHKGIDDIDQAQRLAHDCFGL